MVYVDSFKSTYLVIQISKSESKAKQNYVLKEANRTGPFLVLTKTNIEYSKNTFFPCLVIYKSVHPHPKQFQEFVRVITNYVFMFFK